MKKVSLNRLMSKVGLNAIIFSSVLIATGTHAQDTCPDPDAADREAVINLFKDIRNPSAQVPTTVADFIKLLPEGMRSNYAVMADSRSFQQSTYEDPRVLLKSQNSGVLASFTGHGRDDGLRGTEKVEFIVWNAADNRYDFYEVDFPQEDPYKNPATLTEAQRRPIVKQNPRSCLNCHGSAVGTGDTVDVTNGEVRYVQGALGDKVLDSANARPNWDPYNFWQGQIPFNRDTLYRDSEEARRYLDLIRKMEGNPTPGQEPNARLAALKPKLSSEELTRTLNEYGEFSIPDYTNFDGPGVSLFDQSSRINFCRIGQNLKKLPFYQNIKYAIQGAAQGCDVQQMLPAEALEYTRQYFSRQGIDNYQELVQQTGSLQQSVATDKEARQRQTFANLFLSENPALTPEQVTAKVDEQMNRRDRENREVDSNADALGAMRFLLEPLGVQVANWSMTIDSGTYSFADVLNLSEGAFSNNEGLSCEEIANRTKQSYFSSQPGLVRDLLRTNCEDVQMPVTLANFVIDNVRAAAVSVDEQAQEVFNSCTGCHNKGAQGAPVIPFNDMSKLKTEIRSSARMPNGGLGASIINRINKPEGARGHMPMGPSSLTTEEKTYVRDFIGLAQEAQ